VQPDPNGKFVEVTEKSLKGKWSVLIFMPAAFTFNCPTEIEDAADNYAEFQKAGAEVYIVTTDTHFSHKVWHETSPPSARPSSRWWATPPTP
jgi:alkyl hydroperoxide reductase subunit AhpC